MIDVVDDGTELVQLNDLNRIDLDLVFIFDGYLELHECDRLHLEFPLHRRLVGYPVAWDASNLGYQTGQSCSDFLSRWGASPLSHHQEPTWASRLDCEVQVWRKYVHEGGNVKNEQGFTTARGLRVVLLLQGAPGGQSMFEGLTFKVADAVERSLALDLRRVVYREEFGHVPIDDLDERAYHLIARSDNGEIIATLRVIGPDQRPFDIERYVDLAAFFPPQRAVALVGGLCIRRDHRNVSRAEFLPMGMFKLAYAFARRHNLTDFLTYVYPNLYQFYRGAFFEPLVSAFRHPTWGTVCLMHLDLRDLEARHAGSRGPFARFLFGTDLPNLTV